MNEMEWEKKETINKEWRWSIGCVYLVFVNISVKNDNKYIELIMLLESNHINILLSFVRSISRSNNPDELLIYNKVLQNEICFLKIIF